MKHKTTEHNGERNGVMKKTTLQNVRRQRWSNKTNKTTLKPNGQREKKWSYKTSKHEYAQTIFFVWGEVSVKCNKNFVHPKTQQCDQICQISELWWIKKSLGKIRWVIGQKLWTYSAIFMPLGKWQNFWHFQNTLRSLCYVFFQRVPQSFYFFFIHSMWSILQITLKS